MESEQNWTGMADEAVLSRLREQLETARTSDPEVLLGVEKGADAKEVRAQFLAATKLYHPHRFARREQVVSTTANELFILISRAYATLSGKRKRVASSMTPAIAAPHAEGSGAFRKTDVENGSGAATRGKGRKENTAETRPPPAGHANPEGLHVAHPRVMKRASASPPEIAMAASTVKVDLRAVAATASAARPAKPAPAAVATKTKATEDGGVSQAEADGLFRDAIASLRVGNPGDARKILVKLVRAEPRKRKYRIYYHLAVGRHLSNQEKNDEALVEFDKALDLAPDFAPALKESKELRSKK